MKAVILAAGFGRRLDDSGVGRPKCLLEFEGRTLLDRMLDALGQAGVRDVVVVVGYAAPLVQEAIACRSGVRSVLNPDFRKGAIVSLWSAREELDDELLIMDADVLFPPLMLQRLVGSPHRNCFLLDRRTEDDGEAMLLMARQGRVHDIRRRRRDGFDTYGESVGFLKLEAGAARLLRRLLEQAVREGRELCEHEELYPALMQQYWIGYEEVDDLCWLEIDFPEDVERARALVERGAV